MAGIYHTGLIRMVKARADFVNSYHARIDVQRECRIQIVRVEGEFAGHQRLVAGGGIERRPWGQFH